MAAREIDITRQDYYPPYHSDQVRERSKARLVRMAQCGIEEVKTAVFGYKGVLSGLYIEMVWHYSVERFDDYMEWAETLINRYKEKIDSDELPGASAKDYCEVLIENCYQDLEKIDFDWSIDDDEREWLRSGWGKVKRCKVTVNPSHAYKQPMTRVRRNLPRRYRKND